MKKQILTLLAYLFIFVVAVTWGIWIMYKAPCEWVKEHYYLVGQAPARCIWIK